MTSQKRSRTDGHLSKEQYNLLGRAPTHPEQSSGITVADHDTLVARGLARKGDAKMRQLNRKFKEAVSTILQQEDEVDLTSMIADYLIYSARIQRTYLANSGEVFMCGNGDCGQLGFGTEEMRDMEIKVPRKLPGLSQQKVITVACGGISNVALTQSGRVFTWGSSDDGGLGREGGNNAPEQHPGEVTEGLEGTTIVSVASGDCQTMAVDVSGRVYGWGCFKDKEGKQWFQPPAGEAAKKAKGAATRPVLISGLPSDVAEVKCGASYCLALTGKGGVWSWGIGEVGELAREVCPMKHPPVPGSEDEPGYDFAGIVRDHLTPGGMFRAPEAGEGVSTRMEGVKGIGCGEYHSMVICRGDGNLYSSGLNSYGQLGHGDTTNRDRLTVVDNLRGLSTLAAAGGAQHSLVLTTEGLFGFGRNDSGQAGCSKTLRKGDWGAFITEPTEV